MRGGQRRRKYRIGKCSGTNGFGLICSRASNLKLGDAQNFASRRFLSDRISQYAAGACVLRPCFHLSRISTRPRSHVASQRDKAGAANLSFLHRIILNARFGAKRFGRRNTMYKSRCAKHRRPTRRLSKPTVSESLFVQKFPKAVIGGDGRRTPLPILSGPRLEWSFRRARAVHGICRQIALRPVRLRCRVL